MNEMIELVVKDLADEDPTDIKLSAIHNEIENIQEEMENNITSNTYFFELCGEQAFIMCGFSVYGFIMGVLTVLFGLLIYYNST